MTKINKTSFAIAISALLISGFASTAVFAAEEAKAPEAAESAKTEAATDAPKKLAKKPAKKHHKKHHKKHKAKKAPKTQCSNF